MSLKFSQINIHIHINEIFVQCNLFFTRNCVCLLIGLYLCLNLTRLHLTLSRNYDTNYQPTGNTEVVQFGYFKIYKTVKLWVWVRNEE